MAGCATTCTYNNSCSYGTVSPSVAASKVTPPVPLAPAVVKMQASSSNYYSYEPVPSPGTEAPVEAVTRAAPLIGEEVSADAAAAGLELDVTGHLDIEADIGIQAEIDIGAGGNVTGHIDIQADIGITGEFDISGQLGVGANGVDALETEIINILLGDKVAAAEVQPEQAPVEEVQAMSASVAATEDFSLAQEEQVSTAAVAESQSDIALVQVPEVEVVAVEVVGEGEYSATYYSDTYAAYDSNSVYDSTCTSQNQTGDCYTAAEYNACTVKSYAGCDGYAQGCGSYSSGYQATCDSGDYTGSNDYTSCSDYTSNYCN